ncbi:hypothetical protein BGZ89_011882 [Linnemannia elongata]|nr:hypothetical protein BGZ89_011882 [Linnemannia elongata]
MATMQQRPNNKRLLTMVFGAAFARTSNRLYILGGFPSYVPAEMNAMSQFYYLDLAKHWNGNYPAWTKLSDGPTKAIFPATFSADQKTMVVFSTARASSPFAAWRYSVDLDTWAVSKASFPFPDRKGLASVTDPNTGLVYIAGGYVNPMEGVTMDVYNVKDDSVSTIPMPDPLILLPMRSYYTAVWCQQRKSILFFGGYALRSQPVQPLNSVTEFVPSSNTWQIVPTTGTPPSLRGTHCMAGDLCSSNVDDDGTRVIVYGGKLYGAANITTGDIYVLNTVTGAWTSGKSGSPRIYTTCTIAGDQFLAWGGVTTNNTIPPVDIQIYSISNDNWITSYTPPASYLKPSSTSEPSLPSSPLDSKSRKRSSSVGVIVGGIVGGLVVFLAALFFLYRRRQRTHSGAIEEYASKEDTKNQHNARRPRERRDEDGDDHSEVSRSRIFEPSTASTSRTVHDPTPVVSGSEWVSSSSSNRPVVYDPSSSSPASVSVVRSRKDPEFLSSELLQPDDDVETPRSRHPHTPVSQSG